VTLAGGSYLDNQALGTITAGGQAIYGTGGPATVANSGTIVGGFGTLGVNLAAGGIVTNTGAGLIEGYTAAVTIAGTPARSAIPPRSMHSTIMGSASPSRRAASSTTMAG
jgi:hypothetical protein